MELRERVVQEFERRYGARPAYVVRAPGRVNLIGEHTDYNDGFVLPMAIDQAVWLAIGPRTDRRVMLRSLDFADPAQIDLADLKRGRGEWVEYVKGVAWALQEAGYALRGWEGTLAGDVPIGAGLSSSAALEMATARAFAAVAVLPWEAKEMALLCQRAENEWVGVRCGIMDQLISAAGREGHALLIDCRSLDTEPVPLPPDTTVAVLDTMTRRGLAESAYNERRDQCQAAAEYFGVPSLRDVSAQQFAARASGLGPLLRRRARHVVREIARTLEAAEAMRQGDAGRLGELMNASHASLRDDFEVSSEALNTMVSLAQGQEGCYGARMTGAGFGGCAVALVRRTAVESFTQRVSHGYRERTGLNPAVYLCRASKGAEVVERAGPLPETEDEVLSG